jgi:hypothetical protein
MDAAFSESVIGGNHPARYRLPPVKRGRRADSRIASAAVPASPPTAAAPRASILSQVSAGVW